MDRVKLQATPDDMTTAWEAINKARETTAFVAVSRQALVRILTDHQKLLTKYSSEIH